MKRNLLMASALLTVMAISNPPAQAQEKAESRKSELRGTLNVTRDNWDESDETRIDYKEDGHRYKIKLNGTKIVEMYLDGNKVDQEDFSKYQSLVKKILEQVERDREQARKDRVQADRDREQAERDREQADRDREQADEDRKQAERDRAQAQKDREQANRDRQQAERDREQAVKDRAQAEEDRKMMESMIEELVKEKLIESRDALSSLVLDENELVINGKEQPESVHNRFKQKYLKGKNGRFQYRNSGGSRNLSFD